MDYPQNQLQILSTLLIHIGQLEGAIKRAPTSVDKTNVLNALEKFGDALEDYHVRIDKAIADAMSQKSHGPKRRT